MKRGKSLKSPLGSLPPPKNNNIQKVDIKKITELANKALTSASVREIDDIVQEMRALWVEQNDQLEKIMSENIRKQKQVDAYTEKYKDILSKYEEMEVNTSFHKLSDNFRSSHPEDNLILSIQKTEDEILRVSKVSPVEKLGDIVNSSLSSDRKLFTLVDLNLSRLEEMAYVCKKRLFYVEQSQLSSQSIVKEFGSVQGLFDLQKSLESENNQLKGDEKKFMNDSFTRRRKFALMSSIVARQIITVLNTELHNQRSALEAFHDCNFETISVDASSVPFDDVCKDTNFLYEPHQFDGSEFVNVSSDLAERFVSAKSSNEKLQILNQIIQQVEANYYRLVSEVSTSRSKQVSSNGVAKTRLEMLNEENGRLFTNIEREQNSLDIKNEELASVAKDVIMLIKMRNGYIQRLIDIVARYRDLILIHGDVSTKLYLNTSIVSALYKVVLSLATQLLEKSFDTNKISKYLLNRFDEEFNPNKDRRRLLIPKYRRESVFSDDSRLKALSGPLNKKKLDLHNSGMHNSISLLQISEFNSLYKEYFNSNMLPPASEAYTKVEYLNALSLVYDMGGLIYGGYSNKFHQVINGVLTKTLSDLKKGSEEPIKSFRRFFVENINKIRLCSNSILVKQTENIGTQVELCPMCFEEVQTIEQVKQEVKSTKKK